MLHVKGLIHCCSSHVRRSWSFRLATHGRAIHYGTFETSGDVRLEFAFRVKRKTWARSEYFAFWPRLCENSEVKLSRRMFVSDTLNWKRTALAGTVKIRKERTQFCSSLHACRFSHSLDPKRTYRRRSGALSRARLSCERMPNQSAKDERYPDGQRQQPIRKVGKVAVTWQLLFRRIRRGAVVEVRRNFRCISSGEVKPTTGAVEY